MPESLTGATTPHEYLMAAWLAVPVLERLRAQVEVRLGDMAVWRDPRADVPALHAIRDDITQLIHDLGGQR